MRVLYLHQYFNTPDMVGGTRSYEMARRLVSAGHDVQVVTSWREATATEGWFTTEESGIEIHWLAIPYSNRMTFARRMWAFIRFAWSAAGKAAELRADVVLATSTPLTIALPGIYASRRQRIPMVFEVRDLWPQLPIAMGILRNPISRWAARRLEKWAYASSARVIALSPGMRDGVIAGGIPPERVTVIPNGADLDLFDPAHSDADCFLRRHPELAGRPLVVYAGTIGAINGVDYLIDIARAAYDRNPQVCFVIVGRGAQEEWIRELAARHGLLGKNVVMLEPIPKNMMPSVLAAAHLSLSLVIDLEALWANSANKVFDALASGTPVAINYRGWQADLLLDSDAGLVLPPRSPDDAAVMLLRHLADPEWLDAAGKRARMLARERFDRNELAARLEEVLEQAVRESGGRAA